MKQRAMKPSVYFQSGSCPALVFLGSSGICSKGLKLCVALELLLLLHCFLETGVQGHPDYLLSAVSGSNVHLQISKLSDNNYLRLTLFYNRNQKILEWESNEPNPYYFKTASKDKVTLDRQNGILDIYNVQKEDASTYLLKVMIESGNEEVWNIQLKVYDPVPKPVIKIEKTQQVNNSCFLILSCVIPDKSVNYTWYKESGPFPKELQSDVLEISIEPEDYSKFYTCQVSNPVSSNNDTVYFTSACTPAQSSGVAWIAAWLVVIVPTILGLLLT
ncbi:CD48 antigen [Pteronotus mesoamericanus]|uniref:CD48 antigen n=1 Tax=Pteronotus mesoamericanus TaxID=1884717 RepID=UPI0023EAF5D9|nr:CD48 antigen [Pteronotus parnellii mesoamericanus]